MLASFELKNSVSSTALNGPYAGVLHGALQGLGLCSLSTVQERMQ